MTDPAAEDLLQLFFIAVVLSASFLCMCSRVRLYQNHPYNSYARELWAPLNLAYVARKGCIGSVSSWGQLASQSEGAIGRTGRRIPPCIR